MLQWYIVRSLRSRILCGACEVEYCAKPTTFVDHMICHQFFKSLVVCIDFIIHSEEQNKEDMLNQFESALDFLKQTLFLLIETVWKTKLGQKKLLNMLNISLVFHFYIVHNNYIWFD